ncbi:MAG: M20 family metallopeptidase [Thermonemataceae bacterium]
MIHTVKFTFILLFILNDWQAVGQPHTASVVHKNIQQQTEEIFGDLVKIRKDFHTHPELSGQEKRTAAKIENYLKSLGLEVKTEIGGYGVVGILRGKKKGKSVAWRADIDAIPSNIEKRVGFSSKSESAKHLCGHDVHTTIALGIAQVLANQKEHLQGTVYFIFQPSEENLKGAKAMIDDGLFELVHPDEIYALHTSPFPVGTVATKSAAIYAIKYAFHITYRQSEHEEALTKYTRTLIDSLQTVKTDSPFWNTENLGDPALGITHPNTIYKDYVLTKHRPDTERNKNSFTLQASIQIDDKARVDAIKTYLQQKIKASDYAEELIKVTYSLDYVPIYNQKVLAKQAIAQLKAIYGVQRVIPIHGVIPDDRNDDFAYFQEKIPGVYFFLGCSNFEKGIIAMPHSPTFAVDEECIKVGVQFFSSLIVERLAP